MSEQAPDPEAAMPPTAPAETKTAKEEVIDMLRRLPDDVTLDEIDYSIFMLQKGKLARQSLLEGRVYTQEEVEERFR